MKKIAFALACCIGAQFLLCQPADAGLQLGSTRLIYPSGEKSVTITVANPSGNTPFLVQAEVLKKLNQEGRGPFVVSPQLFRLEAGGENALRIVKLPSDLPTDRESLFWLNVRGIPASGVRPGSVIDDATVGKLAGKGVFALGVAIKLIYRPEGLKGVSSGGGQLKFTRTSNGVKVENPTPFIITMTSLDVGGHQVLSGKTAWNSGTILPFSSEEIPFSGLKWPADIQWQTINDSGVMVSWKGGS